MYPVLICDRVYNGETGTTLKKGLNEHDYAVRTYDTNNGNAVHVPSTQSYPITSFKKICVAFSHSIIATDEDLRDKTFCSYRNINFTRRVK